MSTDEQAQVLVVGSGAGGAVTALMLAEAGFDVLVLEEGSRYTLSDFGKSPTEAMRQLYRQRGMTPILGPVPIGYVEGCCLGGSTEINSGFWHRPPREMLLRWRAQFDLADASEDELRPHCDWAEESLGVGLSPKTWPKSTEVFARGIKTMGWSYEHVPRAAPNCNNTNSCASGCPTGAKQGMTRTIIPRVEAAGARVLCDCRVNLLLKKRGRVRGVVARLRREDDSEQMFRINAEHVFVCAGPTETPALLQRSGIRFHVGNTLRIHPYLKVAARYKEEIDAGNSVLPLVQVKEFWPDISLGGAYFSTGHLAMLLSENWPEVREKVQDHRNMAMYYVGVLGTGKGSVRPTVFGPDNTIIRYKLSDTDCRNLSTGLARLCALLLAGGAEEVYPSVYGVPSMRTEMDAVRWLDTPLPKSSLSLVTVHAFSSCPMGERLDRCAADSYGKLHGFENLYINDASMLPDSPGVNPQGSVMAFARRNAMHFRDQHR